MEAEDDCDDVEEHGPQIIYTSRTHSQLSQFVHEIKKTVYADAKCITLGSRKNLCVNDQVLKLSTLSSINDKCLDLQAGPESSKCPYISKDAKLLDNFADRSLAVMKDIEELVPKRII
jgi:chromosome transmission fidelity protein 1